VVTLILGVAFLAGATSVSMPATVDGVVSWLGRMNLFLFAFNMLPALLLDGGRVLHAALWKVRGSSAWATRVAGRLGQLFGYVMVVGGAVMALSVDLASGLWLALIGWFLVAAAGAETETVTACEALAGLHVSDAMVRHPVTVRGDQTLRDVLDQVFSVSHYTSYPVTENAHALGLLPSAEVVAVPAESLTKLRVRDRMIPADRTLTVTDRDELADALTALLHTELRRALVVAAQFERIDRQAAAITGSATRPRRGQIVIFNSSHYEEVLVVQGHPELLDRRWSPSIVHHEGLWKRRYGEISHWERYVVGESRSSRCLGPR
jgi:CBS domain-containing protein